MGVALALAGCHHVLAPAVVASGAMAARSEDPVRVELGLRLFFDPKLGKNGKMACATCHMPGRGYSNGQATAAGVNGVHGTRNVPSIFGIAKNPSFFWDGRAATLEEQALGPIQNPVEMDAKLEDVVARLEATTTYPPRFKAAFGTGVAAPGIAKAIASFERALALDPSPYDRGELTDSQKRGQALFAGKANCKSCHQGPDFTDGGFHAIGVGTDVGRYAVTKDPADLYAFKTPSLRQVELTAPYMHDGSLPTLEAVVDFFDKGTPQAAPLHLAAQEKSDLVAFLKGLTSPGTNIKQLVKPGP